MYLQQAILSDSIYSALKCLMIISCFFFLTSPTNRLFVRVFFSLPPSCWRLVFYSFTSIKLGKQTAGKRNVSLCSQAHLERQFWKGREREVSYSPIHNRTHLPQQGGVIKCRCRKNYKHTHTQNNNKKTYFLAGIINGNLIT